MTLVFRTDIGNVRLGRVDFVSARRFRSGLLSKYADSKPIAPMKKGEWTFIQATWLEELKAEARAKKQKYKTVEWEAEIWATVADVKDTKDETYLKELEAWESTINSEWIDHVLEMALQSSAVNLSPPFGESEQFPDEVSVFAILMSGWQWKLPLFQFLMDMCEFSFDKVLLCIEDLGIAFNGRPFLDTYLSRAKPVDDGERSPEVEQIFQFMMAQGVGIGEATDIISSCYIEENSVMASRVFAYGWIKSWQTEDAIKKTDG